MEHSRTFKNSSTHMVNYLCLRWHHGALEYIWPFKIKCSAIIGYPSGKKENINLVH